MPSGKKYLIVIAGPTASGKTALAIELAKHYSTEIVSFDSRQFYREMNIGTAKPTAEELTKAPHHFINNLSIHHSYNIGEYEKEAIQLLKNLFEKYPIVIAVGGSGLYINALLNGVDEFIEINPSIKTSLQRDYEEFGLPFLQNELSKLDPDYYKEVDFNNPQRILRALEVCRQSGKPYSSFLGKTKVKRDFESIQILLNLPREILYNKINTRTDKMMQEGFLKEAEILLPFRTLNSLNTVGYKELFMHIEGKLSFEEAVRLIKQKTRNYAKRQLTWFKNQGTYEEFSPDDIEKITTYINIILQHS